MGKEITGHELQTSVPRLSRQKTESKSPENKFEKGVGKQAG